ncbi:MAG: flagellar hook capping FlgD N-terminal domain-containing protein [Planctomycetota bacterium]
MTSISGLPGQSPVSSVLSQSGGSFGENPFLLLLTEQLRNQTPLEPVDNESFMNQMASYSSMQQQQDLNTNMLALLDYQGLLARMQGLSQGSALLGKEVTYTDANGRDVTDLVDSVYVDDSGEVRLRLHDGDEVSLRDVHSIGMADDAGAGDDGASTGDDTTGA